MHARPALLNSPFTPLAAMALWWKKRAARTGVTRMSAQTRRAAAQHPQAAPATALTRTGEHNEFDAHITHLHALLLA